MIPMPKKYFHCLVCDALCEMDISDDSMARIICFSICPDCKKAILYARELMKDAVQISYKTVYAKRGWDVSKF